MHPLIKLLVGVVLLVVPLALYAYDFTGGELSFRLVGKVIKLNLLQSLLIVLQGTIPLFVALVGLFIIWLELDEWKIEKELKREEAKEKKKNEKEKK